ncbi:hypothetical protein TWF191_004669 [Orbilia oligospora]|uniref:Uncharacterized protein n=2 Tax=Orbilia oligospora TaxID=2813651 RepID=A0A7C8QVP1_ORBOL|nr:hypothetical protein TWF191_004669 [Orbilia oligospora]
MALSLYGSVMACVKWGGQLFLLALLYLLALPPVATTLETSTTVRQDAVQLGIVVLDNLKLQRYGSNDLGWSYGFLVNILIGSPSQDIIARITGDDVSWVPIKFNDSPCDAPTQCDIVNAYRICKIFNQYIHP